MQMRNTTPNAATGCPKKSLWAANESNISPCRANSPLNTHMFCLQAATQTQFDNLPWLGPGGGGGKIVKVGGLGGGLLMVACYGFYVHLKSVLPLIRF